MYTLDLGKNSRFVINGYFSGSEGAEPCIDVRFQIRKHQDQEWIYTKKGFIGKISQWKIILKYINEIMQNQCPHCHKILVNNSKDTDQTDQSIVSNND